MAQSVFSNMASEKTLAQRFARSVDQRPSNGEVIFHSTFEDTFDGWRDHYDFKTPYEPIGLTSYPVMSGKHALMLSTSDRATNKRAGATFKNLARYREDCIVSFSGYFAHASMRGGLAWDRWGLSLDTQAWDNSHRAFYKVWVQDRAGSTPAWYLRGADDSSSIIIPGSGTVTSGENENKFNFDYVRLSVDLTANGGLGGYLELQVNHKVFDLRTIFAGTPVEPPQAGGATEEEQRYSSFAGGMNPGIYINPSTRNPGAYPGVLVADDLMLTMEDAS